MGQTLYKRTSQESVEAEGLDKLSVVTCTCPHTGFETSELSILAAAAPRVADAPQQQQRKYWREQEHWEPKLTYSS